MERTTTRRALGVNMTEPTNPTSWQDFLDPDAPLTEESVWQAIADGNDLDYSEIADGDLFEWL
ncbi:MAG: hypothetical protein JW384_01606 [Nitrosomonadaceae bacterium]|nr:hypothetical protein [Nitrosomonadaceae bacterium]